MDLHTSGPAFFVLLGWGSWFGKRAGLASASLSLGTEEWDGGSVYHSEDLILPERFSPGWVKQVSAHEESLTCGEGAPQER